MPRKIKLLCCAIAVLIMFIILLAVIGSCESTGKKTFKFKEFVGTITNPGIGYTTTDWYSTAPNKTTVHDSQGALVLFFINLGQFSAGVNGTTDQNGNYIEGQDYDLDDVFFDALFETFENCKKNGSTIAVRFRYDDRGKGNPEPKTFEQVLKHISQIKQSGIFQEYQDILMFVESGFVGQWGEQHGGKYTSLEYKAQVLEAMLDCVPAPIPVTVRTPDIFAKYVGIKRAELADYVCKTDDEKRVGLYDDGYMGSSSDLGTYANREIETTWLGKQTLTSYFGGEFSGNIDFAKQYDTYLPQNCLPEMYKTHLSYINGNIFQLYKDYKFKRSLDVKGYDNSAYYGQNVWQFIRDHLGYRFVLKKSSISRSVKQGETLDLSFTLVNNGFANPVKGQNCEILLEKDGNFVRCPVELDPTKWYSGKTITNDLQIKLPAFLEEGKWNVYFKSSFGNDEMSQFSMRSIRFANKDVWNGVLGANYLGSFKVKKQSSASKVADNTIYEVGSAPNVAHLYNMGNAVQVDGAISSPYEWQTEDIVAEQDGNKLYLKTDEKNLYLMATLPHKSKAPVFNVRITKPAPTETNPNATKTYWLYQQSNGAMHFNDLDKVGHAGMLMKYTEKAFEFQIPLYMLGLQDGDVISKVSVFVQDSSISKWPRTGGIDTAEPLTVKTDFIVYNASVQLSVKSGENWTFTLLTNSQVASVVWQLDGKTLPETSTTLTLNNITSSMAGTYTAQITTHSGTTKQVTIAVITVV